MSLEYHLPPDDYQSPSIDPGCLTCGLPIIFAPVIGGLKWVHLTRFPNSDEPHDVAMGRWFDTTTGQWREGNDLVTPEVNE